jgi:hypothetical protein
MLGCVALKYQPSPVLQLYGESAENNAPALRVSPVRLL